MAVDVARLPKFARELAGNDKLAREANERVHRVYAARKQSWEILRDAFEGDGGFLTGDYLWPYPAENRSEFVERQKQARYHNYLESLVDLLSRFLFTKGVDRQSNSDELNAWLEDVDGIGTTMSNHMRRFLVLSLVSGHATTLVDKTREQPAGPAKADEVARVIATVFPALAVPDWRFGASGLVAVKLIEAAPPVGIAEEVPDEADAAQYLFWDTEGWARFNAKGELIDGDTPGLEMVPLVILHPKPSYTDGMVGRSLVAANVVKAMYNRSSEEDTVIRQSSFSMLTVSVPQGGDLNAARESVGSDVGATRAVITYGDIEYKTPDQSVAQTIRENLAYLVRELYRAAHVRFQTDSRQAESGEAVRLNYTELNETLQGIGKALEAAEHEIVRAYFAWTHPTKAAADAAYEAASYEAKYPDEFFSAELMVELEAWAEAIRLDLGPTMTKRIKRMAVRRIDPTIPEDELQTIDEEIEQMPDEPMTDVTAGVDTGDPEGAAIAQAANNAA